MRVPHTINECTLAVYQASYETVNLAGEVNRKLKSEDLRWDANQAPSLVDVCVKALVDNFTEKQLLTELPQQDLDLLHESLAVDLPLELTVPILHEQIYWKRCCLHRWTSMNYVKDYGNSWKRLYLERHLQEKLEASKNEDPPALVALVALVAPYVRRLVLRQLQSVVPPEEGELRPDTKRIDLTPLLEGLTKLEELDIVYGVRECGMDFSWSLFQLSAYDCKVLAKGIQKCQCLTTLRVHRSRLDDERLHHLLSSLAHSKTLKHIDFSHCQIADTGTLALARVITVNTTLQSLNLCNNRFGTNGAGGLAYALGHAACPLEELDVSLNSIGDDGAIAFCSTLANGIGKHSHKGYQGLRSLLLAGCGVKELGGKRLGQMLPQNASLLHLDLSNNDMGEVAGEEMVKGLDRNMTLLKLDLRKTRASPDQLADVIDALYRNNELVNKPARQDLTAVRFTS